MDAANDRSIHPDMYVRQEGGEFVFGYIDAPIPERRFSTKEEALRLAEAMQRITGSEIIINIDEVLQ